VQEKKTFLLLLHKNWKICICLLLQKCKNLLVSFTNIFSRLKFTVNILNKRGKFYNFQNKFFVYDLN